MGKVFFETPKIKIINDDVISTNGIVLKKRLWLTDLSVKLKSAEELTEHDRRI